MSFEINVKCFEALNLKFFIFIFSLQKEPPFGQKEKKSPQGFRSSAAKGGDFDVVMSSGRKIQTDDFQFKYVMVWLQETLSP